ncbi:MAG: hypothetical protein IPJ41_09505 [Phycisphaerales bacterium]|nr:hypothetical protein [Phycisphaerales bacterium]
MHHARTTQLRTPPRRLACSGARRSGAFTLLEAALAMVILGVGVLAMVDAQSAFIQSNLWSSHAATATFLAGEIREFARPLARHDPVRGLDPNADYAFGMEAGEVTLDDIDDIDDLDGLVFGEGGDMAGPISALGEVIPEIAIDGSIVLDSEGKPVPMVGWTQEVVVEKVEPYDTSITRADDYWRETEQDGLPPLGRESFPLRVTVIVRYSPAIGPTLELARVSWIVP